MEFIENRLPERGQVLALYEDAGWTSYTQDPDRLMQALDKSLHIVCAYEEGKLVGLLRAVGDGLTILYVQDILVLQTHRRRGIAREMAKRTLTTYSNVRQKVLLTDNTPQMHAFYNALGFKAADTLGLAAFYHTGNDAQG